MANNNFIIFSSDNISRGGKERQLILLFSSLKSYQKLLVVQNLMPDNNYLDEYVINGKELVVTNSKSWVKTFFFLKNLIRKYQPIIVFSWDIKTAAINLILSKYYRFRFVNCTIRHGIRLFKTSHILRSFISWLSPYVIANSCAGLQANNLKENKRSLILYNGVDPEQFGKKPAKYESLKQLERIFKNKINKVTKVFISVANFLPYKDYFTVIDALMEINVQYDFRYLIIGDGPLRKTIEDKIKQSGLSEKVKLLGRVKNVHEYLRMADYFIHSSRGEGISNAILEAMFTGLPVIATSTGGTPELVYKKSFLLFNYKDLETLKKVLSNVDNQFKEFDPESEEYKLHLSKFTTDTMLKNFENIFNMIKQNEHR